MQQGIEQALQRGPGPVEGASGLGQEAQERSVMEQMQKLGLLADGNGTVNPGHLQRVLAMLNKQGVHYNYQSCLAC